MGAVTCSWAELDSVGDLVSGRGQLLNLRHDFDRRMPCWSGKVWKAMVAMVGDFPRAAGADVLDVHGDGREYVL
ncbi:hypothetical protein ADL00_40455 [Streptomyces sp. AS58]|nr:hypothetical protein ADL00_40455 [Streptomyces sp. AS58]